MVLMIYIGLYRIDSRYWYMWSVFGMNITILRSFQYNDLQNVGH